MWFEAVLEGFAWGSAGIGLGAALTGVWKIWRRKKLTKIASPPHAPLENVQRLAQALQRHLAPAQAEPVATKTRDERLKELEAKLNDLQSEHLGCKAKIQQLEHEARMTTKNAGLMIAAARREQTEADLVYSSLKIVCEILGGKKVADVEDLAKAQENLMRGLTARGTVLHEGVPGALPAHHHFGGVYDPFAIHGPGGWRDYIVGAVVALAGEQNRIQDNEIRPQGGPENERD